MFRACALARNAATHIACISNTNRRCTRAGTTLRTPLASKVTNFYSCTAKEPQEQEETQYRRVEFGVRATEVLMGCKLYT